MPSLCEADLFENEFDADLLEDDTFDEFADPCPGLVHLHDDDYWAEASEYDWVWEERPIEAGKRPTFRGKRRF